MGRCSWVLLLVCVWTLYPAPARGQQQIDAAGTPPIVLERRSTKTRIRIDGNPDERVWEKLPSFGAFVVVEPDALTACRYTTRVRAFYTNRGLYVAMDMEQPLETRVKRLSGRDAVLLNRDTVSFTLDTSGTGLYGYWFELGLGDSLSDGTLLPERQYSNTWDGPWRGATYEHAAGWSAEFFVPWGTVSMPHTGDVRRMGLYMSRKVAHLDERWGWPALPLTRPQFISVLQPLAMTEVAPRQQYSVYPFVAAARDAYDNVTDYRLGADLFWRPSTNAQITATLNPDFGVVESDDVVVNLNATETFFPEKRLFFLEGQEIFVATPRAEPRTRDVGNSGAPYTMVNTRRIGGPPREPALPPGVTIEDRELIQPVDLLGAAKATGQMGRLRYGVLAAFEDEVKFDAELAGEDINLHDSGDDYGIARLLYEDTQGGSYRAAGVLSTAVVNPDRDAFTNGVDGHYLSPGGKWKVDAQTFMSEIDDVDRGYGGFIDVEYAVRQGVTQRMGIEYLDKHVDLNDLGYLERNDSLRLRSSHTRTFSNLTWAKDNQFDVRGFVSRNSDDLFTGGGIFFSDRTVFYSLARLTTRVSVFPESYDDLNSFGNGAYRIEERVQLSARWDSDTSKPWGYGIGGGFQQENLRGPTYTAEGQIDWRPNDRFNATAGFFYMDRSGWLVHQFDRNMGTYRAQQWQPKLSTEYFISARQQLRLSLQWVGITAEEDERFLVPTDPGALIGVSQTGPPRDFSISDLSLQLRYRWEIAPLSDIFIVYTRLSDQTRPLGQSNLGNLFDDAIEDPIVNVLVFKIRYRLGS